MDFTSILKTAIEKNVSDIIFTSWEKPSFKINWEVVFMENLNILTIDDITNFLSVLLSESQQLEFFKNKEIDFSIDIKDISRFRVNWFFQKEWIWLVLRPIKEIIPEFDNLNLPNVVKNLAHKKNGLVLITWSVWSWKTTTLASLINEINKTQKKHIITIEDPIEFVFKNNQSIIEQREVWTSTLSFDNWLKYALRQAPDVIMIWEMRDLETFRLALRAAETGNLVFATLHTSWAARTIWRIIDMFPWDEKNKIKQQLSESLIWVVWQQLLKTSDWTSRVAACEVMMNTTSIANMIRKDQTHQIQNAIETWKDTWMITMKDTLTDLYWKWLISEIDYDYNLELLERLY